jgi:hypothetical protein
MNPELHEAIKRLAYRMVEASQEQDETDEAA